MHEGTSHDYIGTRQLKSKYTIGFKETDSISTNKLYDENYLIIIVIQILLKQSAMWFQSTDTYTNKVVKAALDTK